MPTRSTGLKIAGLATALAAILMLVAAISPSWEAAQHLRAGKQMIANNQPKQALEELSKVLAIHPASSEAYHQRALAWMLLNKYGRAQSDCSMALSLDANNIDALVTRAAASIKLHNAQSAIDDLDAYLSKHPRSLQALELRAMSLRQLEKFDLAKRDCDRILAIRPRHIRALEMRGYILWMQKRYDEAIVDLNRLISLNPSPGYYTLRGCCFEKLRNWDKAIADFQASLNSRKTSTIDLFNLGVCYEGKKDNQQALHYYSQVLQLNPESQEARQRYEKVQKSLPGMAGKR